MNEKTTHKHTGTVLNSNQMSVSQLIFKFLISFGIVDTCHFELSQTRVSYIKTLFNE